MELNKKMSYLLGLLDGMEIDVSTKEGKALIQMSEVMKEMVDSIDSLQAQVDELTELCDILDSDLGEVEEDIYAFDDCCCDDEEEEEYYDETYETCCPKCGNTVILNEMQLDKGVIDCPCCGTSLEFGVDMEPLDTDGDVNF